MSYEIHIMLDGAAQDRQRFTPVFGRTPETVSCKAHRAEAQAVYGKFPAQGNSPSRSRGYSFCLHDFLHYSGHDQLRSR